METFMQLNQKSGPKCTENSITFSEFNTGAPNFTISYPSPHNIQLWIYKLSDTISDYDL